MIEIRRMESTEPLQDLKTRYLQLATAPLDGMWLCGFVPMATHYGFFDGAEPVGFCCVNDDGYLLQFYVDGDHRQRSTELLQAVLDGATSATGDIRGAFVSTAEPFWLSLCLDQFSTFEVNALMYQLDDRAEQQPADNSLALPLIHLAQLPQAVEFAVAAIGAPAQWLKDYYRRLIERRELYGVWKDDRLVATGERRGYDADQTEYADVGMIVAPAERGRGLATRILRRLVALNEADGLKSICSTEAGNIGAQKAIVRAGFFAEHRILQFSP